MKTAKSFEVPKQLVMEAYKLVKSKKGAAGVDKQTIEEFEENWKANLYKLWNRMSSGSYFPKPVRLVEIPKNDGNKRKLGIPTVTDRIAQMIVKMHIEPKVDKLFHEDSYGYRPNKSATQAVGKARERCWRYDWVIDIDIKGFFDSINHNLMMKAIKHHVSEKWVILYIERWLKAPLQQKDGSITTRDKGTPQGGVISPLLANLYLHYAFDNWLAKNYPNITFIRYADDILVHCKSKNQAVFIQERIRERLNACKLELHPEKTKIVYCKDKNRRQEEINTKFKFLGYEFRSRWVRARAGNYFLSFTPAVSKDAKKHFKDSLKQFKLYKGTQKGIDEIANLLNPIIRGWINYFWKYNKTETIHTLYYIDFLLLKWARKRYKKLTSSKRKSHQWLKSVSIRQPDLFAHWKMGVRPITIR